MKNVNELEQIAYSAYIKTYANWENYDKLTKVGCLTSRNYFTFASDMVTYLVNRNTAKSEIDSYIKRMLNRFCKRSKQAYYEMILSTMLMANLFNEWEMDDLGQLCNDWYMKLFYDEKVYKQYITEDEISDLWGLR